MGWQRGKLGGWPGPGMEGKGTEEGTGCSSSAPRLNQAAKPPLALPCSLVPAPAPLASPAVDVCWHPSSCCPLWPQPEPKGGQIQPHLQPNPSCLASAPGNMSLGYPNSLETAAQSSRTHGTRLPCLTGRTKHPVTGLHLVFPRPNSPCLTATSSSRKGLAGVMFPQRQHSPTGRPHGS